MTLNEDTVVKRVSPVFMEEGCVCVGRDRERKKKEKAFK